MKRIFLLVMISLLGLASVFAQNRPTHEIHAAMLYNFIKYVQWPDEGSGGDFVVGVLGEDNVYNTLKEWYDGKPKGSKKYVIKRLSSGREAASCHVVYIGKSRSRDLDEVVASTAGKSVLTITDGNGLAQKGSCINFKVVDGRLKFELNQESVATSNLKVSGQLSSMAILI
jgi:hypothetical protein